MKSMKECPYCNKLYKLQGLHRHIFKCRKEHENEAAKTEESTLTPAADTGVFSNWELKDQNKRLQERVQYLQRAIESLLLVIQSY
jgi:hypothetical protein